MKHKLFSLCLSLCFAFIAICSAQAQSTPFKGVVVDEAGEPIIGATVKVVDGSQGAITDLDGKFSINVPAKGKVEISFIGYISQIISNFQSPNVRIVLRENAQQLEEVVVVGYGTQKKAHLTGAIATVPMDEVSNLSTSGLGTALSGLVNGLGVSGGDSRPGGVSRLTIRQSDVASSFTTSTDASNDPLYVIDGFISTSTAFNNLDATMVESISVLKDASAAVYGARSANGVILVTTKKGKVGAPKISYNGQFGYADEVARTKMLNAYDYGVIWNGASNADPQNVPNLRTALFQKDELETMRTLNYDLLDKYWESALTQKHSLNLGGATERANYYGGISYFTQEGNLGTIDYERWNYRAGVDLQIGKWIKTNLQVSGDYGSKTTPYSKVSSNEEADYNILLTHPRYIPEYVGGYPVATAGVNNGTSIDKIQLYHYDMIQNKLGDYSDNVSQDMTINAGLEYDFGWNKTLKGLKFKFTYSKNINNSKSNQFGSVYNLYKVVDRGGSGNHLYTDNGYYSSTEDTGLPMDASNFSPIEVDNGNRLYRSFSRGDNYQMNFIASYARDFGAHHVNGLFTIERAESEYEDLNGTVLDPYTFTNGQANGATGAQSTQFTRSESGTLSYAGRVNYAYADKYLVEFLLRADASTKFAPEHYWGTFPSASLGWVASQESWFKENVKGIDYLKLRGSFGLLGRDNTTAWAWMQLYGFNQDKGAIFGNNASTPTSAHISIPDTGIANRDAHWDKSYKANFGLDLTTVQNRFTVNLDAYYEWNREMFARNGASIPGTIGSQPANENYAEVDNYGVELSLGWRDKIGKDFKYRVSLNTGYGDNKVKKMYWESPISIDKVHPGGRNDTGVWGLESLGMFRSYQEIEEYFDKYKITNYLGLAKENVRPGMLIYKDIRGAQNADGTYAPADGKIDQVNDIVQISKRSSNPWGGTLNLNASWKDFSISTQLSAGWGSYSVIPKNARTIASLTSTATGYNVMEYANIPSYFANEMFVYQDVLDAEGNVVAAANTNAKYPNLRFDINGYQSTFWRISGARVTLRNITLAYALPKTLIQKIGVESCRFNVTAQNLLSLYNPYPENFYDPLSGSYGSYPNLRKITVGVNVSF